MPTYPPYPFPIKRGEGDCVFDDRGRRYFDFYGGHCVCSTGHAHPRLVTAISKQARELLFYSTAAEVPVRTHAAEALIAFANSVADLGMRSVFFCNSGNEANENALKIAAKVTGRNRLIAFEGGWHGRGLWPMAATDDVEITTPFASLLPPCLKLPWNEEAALGAIDFSNFAAVILEPIQSMAGIRPAGSEFLHRLRCLTSDAGTLLIFDEIQTGIGRLGAPFAAALHGITPDIITSAKGIASGIPMGAVLMNESVAAQLRLGDLGSTFGGSPLACAALVATLDVIREERLMDRARDAEIAIRTALRATCVEKLRGAGLLLGLVVPGRAKQLKQHLQDNGILSGGSSDADVLRLMPPLNVTDRAIDALAEQVRRFV